MTEHILTHSRGTWGMVDAWREGHVSHEYGADRCTCPFTAGPLRAAWLAGWDNRSLPGILEAPVEIPVQGKHHREDMDPVTMREARAFLPHGRHHLDCGRGEHEAA